MYRILLLIGSGGFIGSIARYLSQQAVTKYYGETFPFGTLIVNIAGCLIIGVLFGFIEKGKLLLPETRLFLTTGFCGGFTTFSAFSIENIIMLNKGEFFYVLIYVALSVILGLGATYLGMVAVKVL
jgi:CrcB protein